MGVCKCTFSAALAVYDNFSSQFLRQNARAPTGYDSGSQKVAFFLPFAVVLRERLGLDPTFFLC